MMPARLLPNPFTRYLHFFVSQKCTELAAAIVYVHGSPPKQTKTEALSKNLSDATNQVSSLIISETISVLLQK